MGTTDGVMKRLLSLLPCKFILLCRFNGDAGERKGKYKASREILYQLKLISSFPEFPKYFLTSPRLRVQRENFYFKM